MRQANGSGESLLHKELCQESDRTCFTPQPYISKVYHIWAWDHWVQQQMQRVARADALVLDHLGHHHYHHIQEDRLDRQDRFQDNREEVHHLDPQATQDPEDPEDLEAPADREDPAGAGNGWEEEVVSRIARGGCRHPLGPRGRGSE